MVFTFSDISGTFFAKKENSGAEQQRTRITAVSNGKSVG